MNFFEGLFKFFRWIFGFNKQYQSHKKSYGRRKVGGKIMILILMLGMTALAIWLQILTYDVFLNHIGYGILLVLATISVIGVTVTETTIYAVIAFQNYFLTKIDDAVVNKIEEKVYNGDEMANGEIVEKIAEDLPKEKTKHRWLDIFNGIVFTIISAGLFIGSIVVLILKIFLVI